MSSAGDGFDARFGMSYTSFALVGVVVHGAASTGLRAFRGSVRSEQLRGTFEHLLAGPLDPAGVVVLSAVGRLCVTALGAVALLAGVSALVGLEGVVTPSVLVPLALYGAAMAGLGLVSAAVVIVHKEGEPVSWTLSLLTGLFGGVVFPVELLPAWLRRAAPALPTTHALGLIRSALVPGHAASPASLPALTLFALVLPAIGFLALRLALIRARRDGTVGHY